MKRDPIAYNVKLGIKKGGTPTPAIGEGIPPENSRESGDASASLRWLFSEFKRSISDFRLYGDWFFCLASLPLRLLGFGDCLGSDYRLGCLNLGCIGFHLPPSSDNRVRVGHYRSGCL